MAAVLDLIDNIVSVVDVSKKNLGYDFEVSTKDGKKRYYEVKSVDSLAKIYYREKADCVSHEGSLLGLKCF